MEHTTIELDHPITVNGQDIAVLTLRPLTIRDKRTFAASKGSDVDKELAMVANAAGLAPGDLDQLDLRDYRKVEDWLRGFIA